MKGDSRWCLQERIAGLQDWIAATPGACNSGRALGCDDVDRFGWGQIDAVMARDGVLTFRMLPAARAPELIAWATGRGCRVDFWDTFLAERTDVLRASDAIQAQSLPPGLRPGATPLDPDSTIIEDVQALMTQCGVAPYAASMLAGRVRASADRHYRRQPTARCGHGLRAPAASRAQPLPRSCLRRCHRRARRPTRSGSRTLRQRNARDFSASRTRWRILLRVRERG